MVEEILKPAILPLNGKLISSRDSATIQQGDFTQLVNMRYRNVNPRSILGMTKFNGSGETSYVTDGTETPGTYMKTRQGFHFQKNTPHDLGAGTHEGENGFSPPSDEYLIGWYKFDEGAGTIVNNYAEDGSSGGGLLPDMTVYNASGNFWDYLPGFGSTPSDVVLGVTEYSYASFTSRTIGPTSMGMFFRMIPSPLFNRNQKYHCKVSGVSPVRFGIGAWIGARETDHTKWKAQFIVTSLTSETTAGDHTNNVWYFAFYASDEYLSVIFPDGTLLQATATIETGPVTISTMQAGVETGSGGLGDYGSEASYADWIIYNNYVATLADWAEWYDELRTRYGMAARSGW